MNYSLTEQLTNDTFLGYPVYEITVARSGVDLGVSGSYTILWGSDVDVVLNVQGDFYPYYLAVADWATSQSYGEGYSVLRYIKATI